MQEQRFLLITVVLVSLVGAPAVYSVVKDPAQVKNQKSLSTNENSIRKPANVEASSDSGSIRNAFKSKSVVLEFPCQDSGGVQEVDGTLLRLKGGACISQKWQKVSVFNQTNGFTGSVIFLSNDQFTTDFIDLQEGENKLEIQAIDEKGQKVSKNFTVKRRLPASSTAPQSSE